MPTIVLIGPPRSGKSKFVDFLHGKPFSADYTKTSEPTCTRITLKGETIFDIIDLNSSKFESESTKVQLIKADLIMVFCDVSTILSLNAIKKFLPSKLRSNPKTKIILIGSKSKASIRPIGDEALIELAKSNHFDATFFIDVRNETDTPPTIMEKIINCVDTPMLTTVDPRSPALVAAGGGGATSPAETIALYSPVALRAPAAAPARAPALAPTPVPIPVPAIPLLEPELSTLLGEIKGYISVRERGREYYSIFSWLLGGSSKSDKLHVARLLATSIQNKSTVNENSLNPDRLTALNHGVVGEYYKRYRSFISKSREPNVGSALRK